ncbi:class I SAM-dependent methyltransferase, partial [bacterium]|nr:class I SAM-dependent methyltransferase [bacterium]
AGCGSGYNALTLAKANPGAKIVGVDFSSESIHLAQQRSKYHGFEQTEFHVLALEDLPSLGMTFDYINCDEVLYMTSDPIAVLQAMASVLKPSGIIRANLHSKLQRSPFYRAQEVFRRMNLLEGDTGELEVELVRQVMSSLIEGVQLKQVAWKYDAESDQSIRMNYLIQGDRGFTMTEVFEILQAADMELVKMVDWQQWDLMSLFRDPENLPPFLAMSLPLVPQEEQLCLFELLHPIHRLLDFWCVKQGSNATPPTPLGEWSNERWQKSWIYLNPQMKTEQVREHLIDSIRRYQPWQISQYAFGLKESTEVDSSLAACLLPLWESEQPFSKIVEHFLTLSPSIALRWSLPIHKPLSRI